MPAQDLGIFPVSIAATAPELPLEEERKMLPSGSCRIITMIQTAADGARACEQEAGAEAALIVRTYCAWSDSGESLALSHPTE